MQIPTFSGAEGFQLGGDHAAPKLTATRSDRQEGKRRLPYITGKV